MTTVLVVLAVLATVAVLIMGIGSMGRGGEFDEKHDAQLMSARVGLQALALALVVIAALV
ncbi:MAG: hypothetical protein AMJ69_04565 [Gammaproteobacteria bacterium SG8_47]|nr:MAG: hypothetical protein AMJ69_04565 [Gammaproteobacteria bacterium SG8_47]